MKAKRQDAILQIIDSKAIETQDQLLEALMERGFHVTQATVSRDIKELHLLKEPSGYGSYRYAVSGKKAAMNSVQRLRTIFKESVSQLDMARNIVVIKTMPGLASAACAAVDAMDISALVGSLAGDDTAILVMRTDEDALALCDEIHEMLN